MTGAVSNNSPATVDLKFEVAVIPVADVDRAKISTVASVGGWMPTFPSAMRFALCSSRPGLAGIDPLRHRADFGHARLG